MKSWLWCAGATLAGLSAPLAARGDTVERGPVPSWASVSSPLTPPATPQGAVFIERHDLVIHLDAKGQAQFSAFRIRLLHESALQLGNISLVWNPEAGAPVVHALTIHRDGQAIDVLAANRFDVLRREDQLEQSVLDGQLTAVLRVPDLRVGDTLEFSATTRADDVTLGHRVSGVMALEPTPQPGRFRMELNWVAGEQPAVAIAPALMPFVTKSDAKLVIAADNPPSLAPPKGAPPRYLWQRTLQYSDFASWSDVANAFAPHYTAAARLKANSPLKAEAARIAAAHADPLGRAKAALKLVQQQIRYIYVGLDGGNFRPATAEETWQRRYGDCKGKTTLLLALLNELGIAAEPVLVNNAGFDDGIDQRLPSPSFFDHVVVRAKIDGKALWMDGTLPPVAGPSERPVVDYRWGLPLMAGAAGLEAFGWRPLDRPGEMVLHDIDATGGFDTPARITQTMIARGIAGLVQHAQLSAATDAQLETAFRDKLVGGGWDSITDVEYRYDEAGQASVVTIVGTGSANWEKDDDGERWMTLPGGGFSPPGRRARDPGQDQTAPYDNGSDFDCRVTTVRLPADTPASAWRYNTTFDTLMYGERYYRAIERRGQTIRMVRGYRTETRELDAKVAARDNARLDSFDNSMARISFVTGRKVDMRKQEPVPATDEGDWLALDAPCLPKAALTDPAPSGSVASNRSHAGD